MAWKVFDLVVDGIITLKNKVIDVDNSGYLTFDGRRVGQDLPAIEETASATYTQDLSDSRYFEYTLDQASQILTPLNQRKGCTGTLVIKQDATGGWDVAWPSDFLFPEGDPVLNYSPNATNVFKYTVISQNKILIEFISDFI